MKIGFHTHDFKYDLPDYVLKRDFTPGTLSENEWKAGETACTDRHFYVLPNGSEWAVFTFATRTNTGRKNVRYEVWHNGKWYNNYFTNSYVDAVCGLENEIAFFGFDDNRSKYAV